MNIGFIDITIIIAYFLLLIFVGVLASRRAKTGEDFAVAGRRLGVFMYMGCLAATLIGGASTLGTAQLGYTYGVSGIWMVFLIGVGILFLGVFLAKRVFALNVITVGQMLEKRYKRREARLISSIVLAVFELMLAVTQVISLGVMINVWFGWNLTLSMILGGGIVIFYTMIGGMWSVSMTDIIQFVIMTAGIFFIMLPTSLSTAGGWSNLKATLPSTHFSFTNIGFETIIQYVLLFVLGTMVAQDMWQRVFTAKDDKTAVTGTVATGIYSFLFALAVAIIGMCALVVMPNLDDPQNVFVNFAMDTLPVGLLGIVFAALLSALMSTAAGTMLASSTIIVNDVVKPYFMPNMNDKQNIKASRIVTLIVGVLVIVFSVWIQEILVALNVAYAILTGAVFFPIILGFLWKKGTAQACIYSIILSTIAVLVGMAFKGSAATDPIIYGLVTSFISFVVISLLTHSKNNSNEDDALQNVGS